MSDPTITLTVGDLAIGALVAVTGAVTIWLAATGRWRQARALGVLSALLGAFGLGRLAGRKGDADEPDAEDAPGLDEPTDPRTPPTQLPPLDYDREERLDDALSTDEPTAGTAAGDDLGADLDAWARARRAKGE